MPPSADQSLPLLERPEPPVPAGPALPRTRAGVLPAVTLLLLLATVLVPVVRGPASLLTAAALTLGAIAVAAWVFGQTTPPLPSARASRRERRASHGPVRATVELALHLSPVLLLTFVFPVAVARIAGVQVGGVPLTTLLLASSLTVPWLSMAVCLPLYRAVGHLIPVTDIAAVRSRFTQVWPATFLQTAPAVLLFAVPIQLVMRWSPSAILTYVALCLLHAAFAQSLVVGNIERNRLLWASAWVGYAVALLVLPAVWFLPPLVGLLTQLVPLRSELYRMRGWARLDHRDVALDLGRGMLLGSVLWAHLLFLFLKTGGFFDVTMVFVAVLAAVLAYNYYFVRLAPTFDGAVLSLRSAMEQEAQSTMWERSRVLSNTVVTSISRTAFVGAVLGFVIVYLTDVFGRQSLALVAAVAVASWLFLMTTLLCYKLDYIGQRYHAQLFSAAHLAAAVAVFLLLPAGPALYAWLVVLETGVFVAALRATLNQWRDSEYALFWRHATAW